MRRATPRRSTTTATSRTRRARRHLQKSTTNGYVDANHNGGPRRSSRSASGSAPQLPYDTMRRTGRISDKTDGVVTVDGVDATASRSRTNREVTLREAAIGHRATEFSKESGRSECSRMRGNARRAERRRPRTAMWTAWFPSRWTQRRDRIASSIASELKFFSRIIRRRAACATVQHGRVGCRVGVAEVVVCYLASTMRPAPIGRATAIPEMEYGWYFPSVW